MAIPPAQIRVICPVCGENVIADRADCGTCGRRLAGPLRLGRLTPADLDAAAAELAAAGRAWDLAAARRAGPAAGPHPAAGTGRLAALARPSGHGDTQMPVLPGDGDTPTAGLPDLARRLHGDQPYHRISIVEIAPEGLRLSETEEGGPALRAAWSRGWRQICPRLSADSDARLFQLAGGVGQLRPISRPEWDAQVGAALGELTGLVRPPLLLVTAPRGWVLLERAAADAARALTTVGVVPALGDRAQLHRLVVTLLRGLPPPEGYDLLLAAPGTAGGGLTLARYPLLAPEPVEEDTDRTAHRVVYGPGAGGEVLIPVVPHAAGLGAAVTAIRLRTTPGEPVRITARQDTPGRVKLIARDAVTDDVPWPDRAAALPTLLRATDPEHEPLDLAVTVELGGGEWPLAQARELLVGLGEAGLLGPPARVAVITYGDHRPGQTLRLDVLPFGDPEVARRALGQAHPVPGYEDLLAPLEDALTSVTGLGWRPGGRRVVVPFATRLPHPPHQDWGLTACTQDLGRAAAGLQGDLGVRILPVVTEAGWSGAHPAALEWAKRAWAAISDEPAFDDVAPCLRALRTSLAPSSTEPLRLALAEQPRP
ncbi:hypothetical protein ACIA8K_29185 [Catenuloplanes sp. NPDC051500]|uniref:hypothetical protein n=1 Tax=Catenuloplanes sp. NPDC051500 TaxID=3363959 RepID=UPI0037B81539